MTDIVTSDAPLTIEQAVKVQQAIRAKSPPQVETVETDEFVEPEGEADTSEIEESEADAQLAEDVESEPLEANADGDEAEPPEPVEPAIEPPQFWDAEGKERFAKLSPASQREVLEYEKQRTAAVAKAMQKSAETAKAAEAKLKQLQEVADQIGENYVEPRAKHMQAWDQWLGSNAAAQLARENPAAYAAEIARYDREKRDYDKVIADKKAADAAVFAEHVTEQRRLLAEVAPELADPKEGPARMRETLTYLTQQGMDAESLRWITAKEAAIAHKAMLYDRAQAKAKEAPKPKPKPAGPNAAPAGQGVRASSSEARLKALNSKHSLTVEEAIELRRLKRK